LWRPLYLKHKTRSVLQSALTQQQPVFHLRPDRIRAHALIYFLALVLYRVLRMRLKDSRSPTHRSAPWRSCAASSSTRSHFTRTRPKSSEISSIRWADLNPHRSDCSANFETLISRVSVPYASGCRTLENQVLPLEIGMIDRQTSFTRSENHDEHHLRVGNSMAFFKVQIENYVFLMF